MVLFEWAMFYSMMILCSSIGFAHFAVSAAAVRANSARSTTGVLTPYRTRQVIRKELIVRKS
jgi:hypothetical protein